MANDVIKNWNRRHGRNVEAMGISDSVGEKGLWSVVSLSNTGRRSIQLLVPSCLRLLNLFSRVPVQVLSVKQDRRTLRVAGQKDRNES